MRLRTALLVLACVAWGTAVSDPGSRDAQGGVVSDQGSGQTAGHGNSREKRQALLNPGAGSGCADWSLLNYLLYYYLIQAQTSDAAQIQHQQTDQMAAALLKLRRVRGTDPLPTLLSQPAGQAAIITLLQKVTEGDTGQLLLLLADIRDHGSLAAISPSQRLGPAAGRNGPGLGVVQAPLGQQGSLRQQAAAFAGGPAQQPFPGPGVQQFGPLGGVTQQGLTGRQVSGQEGGFGLSDAGRKASGFQAGPQAQAQTAARLSQAADASEAAPSVSQQPTNPPPTQTPRTTRKPLTTPKPRSPLPPSPKPAVIQSRVLAPSTSYHVTTSTLVTTILLRKTKTVPAVRGDTPTTVQHVHTVTHVLTATGLRTNTVVVTPTRVISAGTTRTVFGEVTPPGAVARTGRARRAEPSSAGTPELPQPTPAQS